jgi:hypothetical protein
MVKFASTVTWLQKGGRTVSGLCMLHDLYNLAGLMNVLLLFCSMLMAWL